MRARAARSVWNSHCLQTVEQRPLLSYNRPIGRRYNQVNSTRVSTISIDPELPSSPPTPTAEPGPDARFEVLGAPYSLLSVQLSASQNLYTRRGTLVAVTGKAENAVSTLSILEPFRRTALGIPFLYQKVSSATPITALISTKSPITSVSVVHLDGTQDWIVAQRDALLAWTGHALSLKPTTNAKLGLAHWGNSYVSGRGLLALAGKGNIFQIRLKAGEQYVVHPGNLLAYNVSRNLPQPYRFKSNAIRFQIPTASLGRFVPETKFFKTIGESQTWRNVRKLLFALRTWTRRSIWGDRLFLQFEGPASILIQSRESRLTDVLTTRDINEIADSPPGAVHDALQPNARKKLDVGSSASVAPESTSGSKLSYANVTSDGKVDFKLQ